MERHAYLLIQAQDLTRHSPRTSNPTNPNCNRANAAVVGCTCSPAVQVGDKAMLPASAMMCDSAEHVGFESGDPIGPI